VPTIKAIWGKFRAEAKEAVEIGFDDLFYPEFEFQISKPEPKIDT
jgi:hypothetical protein